MKRIISLALVIVSLMGFMAPMSSHALENGSLAPEELGLLTALSLVGEESLCEGETFTRAEYCALICRLFRYEVYSAEEMPFRDIDSTHPHYQSVSALYAKGVVQGLSKYAFAPNKEITLGEAAIIAVAALGYDKAAEMGLTTYYAQAETLGLFKGIASGQDAGLTEEMAAKLMYNILFAPIMTYKPENGGLNYTIDKDVLMMGEIYDLYEIQEVLTENGTTSFYGASTIGGQEIKIGENVYINGMEGLDGLIGYPVKAYVQQPDGEEDGTVIFACKDSRKCADVEIDAEDILSAEKTLIEYESGNKIKKVKISKAADVVYNGMGVETYDKTTLHPVYGKLLLVDNDNDGTYDVVFVTNYQLVVAQSVATNEKRLVIADKYGNDFSVDLNHDDCTVQVWRKNEAAELSQILSGDALLIADSGARGDGRIVNIYLPGEKLTGTLNGVYEDAVMVDSRKIETSPFADIEELKKFMQKGVVCYTDIYGKVLHVAVSGGGAYGFLFKAFIDDGTEDVVKVKILDTSNVWQTYTLSDKVKCNGETKRAAEFYETKLMDGSGVLEKQLVRFGVNSSGEINQLDLAEFKTDKNGLIDKDNDAALREKGYFRKSLLKEERRFAHNTKGLFEGKGYDRWLDCFFPGSFPVLVRPDTNDLKEEDVLFYTNSYFKTDNDYICEGYDLTEENYVSIVVVYASAAAEVGNSDRFIVVDHVTDELNEEDETVRKLYAWQAGDLVAFEGETSSAFIYSDGKTTREVKRGDVIRVATNFSGRVESVEAGKMRFSVDQNPEQYYTDHSSQGSSDSDAYGYNQIAVGKVEKVYGNYLKIAVQNGAYINVLLRNEASYILYDSSARTPLSKVTQKEITAGDIVVTRLYFGRLDDVVIYRLS